MKVVQKSEKPENRAVVFLQLKMTDRLEKLSSTSVCVVRLSLGEFCHVTEEPEGE